MIKSGKVNLDKISKLSIQARESGRSLTQTLLSENLIDEEELAKLQSEYFHIPYTDLRSHTVSKEILDLMPQSSIANYRFSPFAFDGRVLKVALTDPTDLLALEALEFFAQKKHYIVEIYLASMTSFKHAVSQSKDISAEVSVALEDIALREKSYQEKRIKESEKTVKATNIIAEAPISKIVDVVLRHAIEERASDIHIEPGEHDLRVRYRIDGVLQNSLVIPKSVHPAIISRLKMLTNLKIDEHRLPQDGRFKIIRDTQKISCFRVSTIPTFDGEKIVMRLLEEGAQASYPGTAGLCPFGAGKHQDQPQTSARHDFWSPGRPAAANPPPCIPC